MSNQPPITPDGLPILTAPANTGVVGTASIYDWILPEQLDPNKRTIWYDIKRVAPQLKPIIPSSPVLIGGEPLGSFPQGVTLPNGQVAIVVPGPTADGTPLLKMPDGSYKSLGSLQKVSKDRMVSPSQIMQSIASMSVSDPKGFMAIQTYLSSGVWGTVHVNGSFDHETEVALGNAMLQWTKLTRNTEMPVDFKQYLAQAGSQALQLGNGTGGSPSQPAPIQVTDPDTIKLQAQQAAQNALGHTLSEGELNSFVQEFQSAQRTYQTTDHGVISAPDLSTEADKFVQQSHPQQFKQNNEQAYFNELVNMLTSGAQRPSMEPVAPVS